MVPSIVMGGFNINIHCDVSTQSGKLIDIIDSFNMLQHVGDPTHSRGHILDLVISRAFDQLVSSVAVKPMAIGDHNSVDCVLTPLKPSAVPTGVQVRNFKRIDLDQFQRDVGRQRAELAQSKEKRLSELSEAYFDDCKAVLDKHAPLETVVRKSHPKPRYNDDVDQMRDKRRHLSTSGDEPTWISIASCIYVNARNAVTSCIAKAKIQFHCGNLEKANNKSTFRLVRSLGSQQKVIYPEFSSQTEGCDQLSAYFAEKVTNS